MRPILRRITTLGVLGAIAVASSLPAAAQSGRAQGITQRQSILTELSPTGEAGTSRVFTQLTVTGDGPVTVSLPGQATSGLRSLDGFAGPDVEGDEVIHTLEPSGVDGARARTVADNTAELPVSVAVTYRLDGTEVDPSDLAGRTGQLEVAYTIRNHTAEPRDIVSFDAQNNRTIESMDIAVPMVGSLSLTLPPTFTDVQAPGGVTAGDGRGNTVVNFSLLLFSPLGSEEQTVTWTADAVDAVIPETSIQVLPVDDRSFGSLNATASAYEGASASLTELANGALIIDSNLQLLGAGASELLAGLNQLADGADQLADGLVGTAVPGADQLAGGTARARAGAGELSTGLGELALGATRLSVGLNDARAGGSQLSGGLGALEDGAVQIATGLGAASVGADELATGLGERAAPGAVQLRDGLQGLLEAFGAAEDGAADGTLLGGVATLRDGLVDTLAPGTGALAQLSAGLADSFGPDASGDDAGDRASEAASGAGAIAAGGGDIEAGGYDLAAGIDGLRAQSGAIPTIDHLDYASIASQRVCLSAADPENGIPSACYTDGLVAALTAGAITTMADYNAARGTGVNSAGLATVDALLSQLRAGAVEIAEGGAAIEDGAGQLRAGLRDQADALGSWPASCEVAIAAVRATTTPTGLQVIRALECIAAQVDDGLTGLVIPGVEQLRGGLSNPAAFDPEVAGFNPACADATAANGLQPCGVQQALQLLGAGAGELATGLGDADAGSEALAEGLRQLALGGRQLAEGAGTAAAGSGSLLDGLRQLDTGGGELAAGANRAAAGSTELADGLVQLDDGAGRLAAGLGDAAAGSSRIAEGLSAAADGGTQLADGTVRLSSEGFGSLIDGISTGKHGASRDHEQVRAVIARGREGAAPYGVADGAEATTVFQFDLAGVGTEEGPSTPLLATLAGVALAAAGALGVGLRRRLLA